MQDLLKAIDEAVSLLPSKMDSEEARLMLMAIGLQNSRFKRRQQLVGSPPKPVGTASLLNKIEQLEQRNQQLESRQ